MNPEEALEWVKGLRSMCNVIPRDPYDTWEVRVAQADAAKTQQAYWVLKYEEETQHAGNK